MRAINNIKIGIKTQFATVTIVVLLAIIALGVVVLRWILTAQVDATVSTTQANALVNGIGAAIQQYMDGGRSFEDLQKDYASFQDTAKGKYSQIMGRKLTIQVTGKQGTTRVTASLGEHIDQLWKEIQQSESIAQDQANIEQQIISLSNVAISKSNEYLASISERLSDPVQQRKVSMLERKVIQGASINTTSNFTIQVLFKDMKSDLANKDKLFQFLDVAEKNSTTDAERLAGTAFQQLPKDSIAAIQKIRELAQQWVADETNQHDISAQAGSELASLLSAINDSLVMNTRAAFYQVISVMTTALYVFIVVVAFIVLLQVVVSRSITKPIRETVGIIKEIEQGNFSVQAEVSGKDESGQMLASLNAMVANVSAMIHGVQKAAEQLAGSSQEISQSAEKLSEGSQSQASSLEQTSASMEELSASVEQVAEHAQSQAAAAEQGTSSMTHALGTIEEVSRDLEEIATLARKSVESAAAGAQAVQSVVQGINTISQSSEKIGGIVTVISDIADQTNLLALNASIEAARAGEHGRGFAVVADEVSKLADRSSSSTKEIETLIKESIRNVTLGVDMSRNSEKAIDQIRDASQQVSAMIAKVSQSMGMQVNAIKELAKALENVSEMSQSISASTEEQTTNAKQVSNAIESVNELTQQAAASAEHQLPCPGAARPCGAFPVDGGRGTHASYQGRRREREPAAGTGIATEKPAARASLLCSQAAESWFHRRTQPPGFSPGAFFIG
jgi:methyl-accepting chemotaxis protein